MSRAIPGPRAFSWIIPALLLAACAGPRGRPAPSGYTHTYDLKTGDVLRFETLTTTSISSEMLDMVMPGGIEVRSPGVSRIDITGQAGENWTGDLTIEKFSLEGLEGIMGGLGGMLGDMDQTGKRMPFTLEPNGRSSTKVDLGSGVSAPFGGEMMTAQGLGQFFIPWTDRPLAVGEAWTDSTTQEQDLEGGVGISTTIVTCYTYLGLVEDETGSGPLQAVHAEMRGSMAGAVSSSAAGADMQMTMVGTWTGQTEYRFDPRDGLLVSSSGAMTMSMSMDMSVPMPINIPMTMDMTMTAKRIR
jgi:hypothetical protein